MDAAILIVDDSQAILQSLAESLKRLGVPGENILLADTPEKALKIFNSKKPGVVLMDLDLAGAPGDKAALLILKSDPTTKLVVMTGYERQDPRVRELISAGAYEYLEKPLRFAKLQELLQLLDSESKGLRRVR